MEVILLLDMLIKSSIKDYRVSFVDNFDNSLIGTYKSGDFIIVDQKIFNCNV